MALGVLAEVPGWFFADADRPDPGDPAGENGKLAYLGGHIYEVSQATAAALADMEPTTARVNGVVRNVRMGDYVRREELPEPAAPVAMPSLHWTQAQKRDLDAMTSRLDAIEARQSAEVA